MKLTCSNCQTNYRIADEKIPAGGARASCPNCGRTMIIAGAVEGERSESALMGRSGTDYGQTMAYDFSEVDQSQSEVSTFLEKISEREPFIQEGLVLFLKELQTGEEYPLPLAQLTVGRKGVDINVDDPEVSRKHCLVKVLSSWTCRAPTAPVYAAGR